MPASDIYFLSIAKGEPSPVEVMSAHLERIKETDSRLNSFMALLEAESMAEAREAETFP